MHSWRSVLSRADEVVMQEFLGEELVQLLGAIEPGFVSLRFLRGVLEDAVSIEEIVLGKKTWPIFVDLIPSSMALELSETLGLGEKNIYEALKRIPLRVNSTDYVRVLNFFGHFPSESSLNSRPTYQARVRAQYPLFPHQRRAVSEVEKILWEPEERVMLHMPTGAGKTRSAMHLISYHLSREEKKVVIWLANSEELCEQAAEEFEVAWNVLGNREVAVGRFWGASDLDLDEFSDGIVVAGIDKLRSLVNRHFLSVINLADRTSLVVFDEAHQAIATTYRDVLEIFLSRPAPNVPRLLGLSATPGRTWNDPVADQELADFFFGNKVALKVDGYENPVTYLVDQGYLAKAKFIPLHFDSGSNFENADSEGVWEFEISREILEALGASVQRNLLILTRLRELLKSHKRVIYFAPSVQNANLINFALRATGEKSVVVTGETPSEIRKSNISLFKSDTDGPMVICNYGVLTTGFDAPATSAALIARPTTSLVLYSQMVGRAIRGVKAGGNSEATIVTVVDSSLPGFGRVEDAFTNWEDVWS